MRKANQEVELLLIPGAEHGFTPTQRVQSWEPVLTFFGTHLRTK